MITQLESNKADLKAFSNVKLSDDNFNDECDKLCETLSLNYGAINGTVDSLPDGFLEYPATDMYGNNLEFAVHINSRSSPNIGGSHLGPRISGTSAYQFGDCYVLIDFDTIP